MVFFYVNIKKFYILLKKKQFVIKFYIKVFVQTEENLMKLEKFGVKQAFFLEYTAQACSPEV